MTEEPVYLIINATPDPEKMEQFIEYNTKIVPVVQASGAEIIGRFKVTEQLKGEGGPKAVAIFKFANPAGVEKFMTSDGFTGLAALRAVAFSKLDIMLSQGM
ncbi:MAG: DUF1330 domain-containing protein [SAR324 cluster bacterium]|nr:DUF1330 domain-containing protein [SAR324 cluster bacterium]